MEELKKITVIITDDHKLVINGLMSILKNNDTIDVIHACYNAQDLLLYLTNNTPNVLLLDINLPDINGIEICKIISRQYADLKVIALTNYNEITFVRNMLNNGAKGYLLKNSAPNEIVKAIKQVHAGGIYLPDVIQDKILQNNFSKQENKTALTRNERKIINALKEDNSIKSVALSTLINEETILNHLNNLYQKFEVNTIDDLLTKATSD